MARVLWSDLGSLTCSQSLTPDQSHPAIPDQSFLSNIEIPTHMSGTSPHPNSIVPGMSKSSARLRNGMF
jgi:hypothetical protein